MNQPIDPAAQAMVDELVALLKNTGVPQSALAIIADKIFGFLNLQLVDFGRTIRKHEHLPADEFKRYILQAADNFEQIASNDMRTEI